MMSPDLRRVVLLKIRSKLRSALEAAHESESPTCGRPDVDVCANKENDAPLKGTSPCKERQSPEQIERSIKKIDSELQHRPTLAPAARVGGGTLDRLVARICLSTPPTMKSKRRSSKTKRTAQWLRSVHLRLKRIVEDHVRNDETRAWLQRESRRLEKYSVIAASRQLVKTGGHVDRMIRIAKRLLSEMPAQVIDEDPADEEDDVLGNTSISSVDESFSSLSPIVSPSTPPPPPPKNSNTKRHDACRKLFVV